MWVVVSRPINFDYWYLNLPNISMGISYDYGIKALMLYMERNQHFHLTAYLNLMKDFDIRSDLCCEQVSEGNLAYIGILGYACALGVMLGALCGADQHACFNYCANYIHSVPSWGV